MCSINLVFLWLFAASAAYTDFRHRKVPNRLLAVAGVCGLVLSACGGWLALRGGLAGLALGSFLLLPAFILGMVGGGDVKSLAILGLFTGPELLWISFLRGVVIAGAAGLVILTTRRVLFMRRGRNRGIRSGRESAGSWTLPYAAILLLCAALSAACA
jgi:Flp pilus assembly protein protease CpaA